MKGSCLIFVSRLVSPSATWSLVGMYLNSIFPSSCSCLLNFSFTSICLVLPLNPGVLAETMVAWLSQYHGILDCSILSSTSSPFKKLACLIPLVRAVHSDSEVLKTILLSVLEDQLIGVIARSSTYPAQLFLVSTSAAKSASKCPFSRHPWPPSHIRNLSSSWGRSPGTLGDVVTPSNVSCTGRASVVLILEQNCLCLV